MYVYRIYTSTYTVNIILQAHTAHMHTRIGARNTSRARRCVHALAGFYISTILSPPPQPPATTPPLRHGLLLAIIVVCGMLAYVCGVRCRVLCVQCAMASFVSRVVRCALQIASTLTRYFVQWHCRYCGEIWSDISQRVSTTLFCKWAVWDFFGYKENDDQKNEWRKNEFHSNTTTSHNNLQKQCSQFVARGTSGTKYLLRVVSHCIHYSSTQG